jgi:hypothetical protein
VHASKAAASPARAAAIRRMWFMTLSLRPGCGPWMRFLLMPVLRWGGWLHIGGGHGFTTDGVPLSRIAAMTSWEVLPGATSHVAAAGLPRAVDDFEGRERERRRACGPR